MVRPFVYYAFALFFGSLAAIFSQIHWGFGAVLAASFSLLFLYTLEKPFYLFMMFFFILGAANLTLYFHIHLPTTEKNTVRIVEKRPFSFVGKVQGKKIELKGNLKGLEVGDKINITGVFQKIPQYDKGIVGSIHIKSKRKEPEDLTNYFYSSREKIYDHFVNILGKEKTALVMGVCFGDTQYLSLSQKESFQTLGISHVISVSGLHMAVFYEALAGIVGLPIAMFLSFFYLLFTGAKAATIRAFVMIIMMKLSTKVYKQYDSLSALGIAAFLLLLMRPYAVLDMGFHLSFLSVIGIILYHKKISRILYKLPQKLNESLSLSLSAQILSLPYVFFTLQSFSFAFLWSNLILLPFYTMVVIIGNLALACIKFPWLFSMINYILFGLLTLIEGGNTILLKCSPPIFYITNGTAFALLAIYGCYLLIRRGYTQFKYLPLFLVFLLWLEGYTFFPQVEYRYQGNKDCILVRYHGKSLLISSTESIKKEKILPEPSSVLILRQGDRISIPLGKQYRIEVTPTQKDKLQVQVQTPEKQYVILSAENFPAARKFFLERCDIMEVTLDKSKRYYLGEKIVQYVLVRGKVIKI